MTDAQTPEQIDPVPERIDVRGLKCPLPALFARRALGRASSGALVEVIADDPLAAVDIPFMCHQEGHVVAEQTREGRCVRFVLRRAR